MKICNNTIIGFVVLSILMLLYSTYVLMITENKSNNVIPYNIRILK
jgi:uncharacterized membrane protein YukC